MGFDLLGADYLGFDWMQMVKGAAGALSNAGAGLSPSAPAVQQVSQQALIERARLEEERRQAEKSATTMKLVAGAAAVAALGLGVALVVRK